MKIFVFFVFFGTSSGFNNFFFRFLVPLQVFSRFYCQSLRRYHKKTKPDCQNLKMYKKTKKNKDFPIFGPGGFQDIFFCFFFVPLQVLAKKFCFFVPLQVLARFYCQNLRRYQQKKRLPKREEVPKKPKNTKLFLSSGLGASKT